MPALTELTTLTPIECCAVVLTGFAIHALASAARACRALEESRRYWLARQREPDRREAARERAENERKAAGQ